MNEDGTFDTYFALEDSTGFKNNWLPTTPGKSWFFALRLYGLLEPWINKTWILSEVKIFK